MLVLSLVTGLWIILIIQFFEIRGLKKNAHINSKQNGIRNKQMKAVKDVLHALREKQTIYSELLEFQAHRLELLENLVSLHEQRLDIDLALWNTLAGNPPEGKEQKDPRPSLHVVKPKEEKKPKEDAVKNENPPRP